MKRAVWIVIAVIAGLGLAQAASTAQDTKPAGEDRSQSRLVMVKVPNWKVKFFGLPEELPVLLEPGETFNPGRRVYDFSSGLQAMEVFLALRPQAPSAAAFRLFLKKWPLYQEFFKAVDAEKFESARALIQQIAALDPKEPAVHFYQGSLGTQFGDYALAEKEYRACLDLYPGYGPVYINLARLAMARQAKDEAAAFLRRGLDKMDDADQSGSRKLAEQMLKNLERK